MPAKRLTCETARLTEPVGAGLRVSAPLPAATFIPIILDFGNSTVLIYVSPDEGKGVSAPATTQ
ncbi:hypothetical protein AB0H45_03320 [Streptomyces atroolivaceus]|uniref:Uncharacterized protein n=1 Tax=Streptomyces atroolivaceus TaxID=66869 RepID=A0ABV9V4W2_STRAZ|nr:hypothetical protein [Streptomyces atroolivaceus]